MYLRVCILLIAFVFSPFPLPYFVKIDKLVHLKSLEFDRFQLYLINSSLVPPAPPPLQTAYMYTLRKSYRFRDKLVKIVLYLFLLFVNTIDEKRIKELIIFIEIGLLYGFILRKQYKLYV